MALRVEEVPTRLGPKVKAIGPCSDPPSEQYILRFDLYQASQLCQRTIPDNTQVAVLQVGGEVLAS